METNLALTILYVADLERASAFYDAAFGFEKTVDVPVYVEYAVNSGARLGLMLQSNTNSFLGDALGGLTPTDGCPRAEVYLRVDDVEGCIARLQEVGAVCTSQLAKRDWGDRVAYYMDLDGYVVAIAEPV